MPEINWKSKYNELKAKYMSAVDTAYRLGIEQGIQQAQQQQMQEQQAQEQAMQQAAMQGQGQPGEEQSGQEGGQDVQNADSAHPQGSELDQHISQLESMLGKSELTADDLQALQKSVKALKFGIEMKKSDEAVRGIARALKPKFTPARPMNKNADANLSQNAKAALSLQQQIVDNVMKGFEEEEQNLSKSIAGIVAGEGLKKD